ncbi:hypothetical protein [Flavobacterium sp.]|uniref:hypothetical protein n=1 Tax=Flavobacterium sp. TaxID=239 RepID=UPI00375277F7
MVKKKKIVFSIIIVLIILKLFGGIYEDDEFEEKYFFIKNKPSFKTYFYSPRGMSDMTIEQMSENQKKEQILYDEFVFSRLLSFQIW